MDGYLSGCTLVASESGATAVSSTNGSFSFSPSPRYGSIDISPNPACKDSLTGIPLSTASQGLCAPVSNVNPLVVSPFTTLVQAVVDADAGYDASSATLLVASALGLDGVPLLTYDPVGR